MKKLKAKNINLIAASKKKQAVSLHRNHHFLLFFVPACLSSVFLLLFLWIQLQNHFLLEQTQEVSVFLSAAEDSDIYWNAVETEEMLMQLYGEIENLQLAKNALNSYPQISKKTIEAMKALQGDSLKIQTISYDRSKGAVILYGQTKEVTEASAYVKRLRESNLFSALNYTGYQMTIQATEKRGKSKNTAYQLQITGILR